MNASFLGNAVMEVEKNTQPTSKKSDYLDIAATSAGLNIDLWWLSPNHARFSCLKISMC